MKLRWFLACMLLMATAVCWAEKAKKDADKASAPSPPVEPKVIMGYRAGEWGMAQDKVMAKENRRYVEVQQEPDYLRQLGLPGDMKALVPDKLPRRAPFRNFERILDEDAAECKVVYYFYEDRLYMIYAKEPLLREILKFKAWRERMLERLGAPTRENPDGSIIWDQDITYCTATPVFSVSTPHNDNTLLDNYTVFLYSKKLKKDVMDWLKEKLRRSAE